MRTEKGKRLGYNTEPVVDDKQGIVVQAEMMSDPCDSHLLESMLRKVQENPGEAAKETVADKGYRNHRQLGKAAERGYQVLVPLLKDEGE